MIRKGEEAIGFLDKIIEIPGDTLIELQLFKEPARLSFEKIEQADKNHIWIQVTVLSTACKSKFRQFDKRNKNCKWKQTAFLVRHPQRQYPAGITIG